MKKPAAVTFFTTNFLFLGASDLRAEEFPAPYKQFNPSVVATRTLELVGDGNGIREQRALGSGILADEQGFVITASHAFRAGKTIELSVDSP